MKGISRSVLKAGVALALSLGVLPARPAHAAPLTAGAIAATLVEARTADAVIRVGACRDGCDDCNDCPTEIDIAPPRDDLIARQIERSGPAPVGPCATNQVPYARPDGDSCGIRCWYWRLRHGYCGPGCVYYLYRMYQWGKPSYHHPGYACGS
jgi:hypothetical protein